MTKKRSWKADSDSDLARLVAQIAHTAQPDAILCVSNDKRLPQDVAALLPGVSVIAATTEATLQDEIVEAGLELLQLPWPAADKYAQIPHALSVALGAELVDRGDLVLCALSASLFLQAGALLTLTVIDEEITSLPVTTVLEEIGDVRRTVLEAALVVAFKISRAVERDRQRLGAIFMIGDVARVLEGAEQIVPNPFNGLDEAQRQITDPDFHGVLVELAKLDGAFVIRGDGVIESAAVFLAPGDIELPLPGGLGARHRAAAGVTARSESIAIVVSAADGNVRIFANGRLAARLDPDALPHAPAIEQ